MYVYIYMHYLQLGINLTMHNIYSMPFTKQTLNFNVPITL